MNQSLTSEFWVVKARKAGALTPVAVLPRELQAVFVLFDDQADPSKLHVFEWSDLDEEASAQAPEFHKG